MGKRLSTKERILLAAETEFAAHGFSGTTTRSISRRARVNNSTLHYHWHTKEELYSAVFQKLQEEIAVGFRATMNEFRDYDFSRPDERRAAIFRLVEILIEFIGAHPYLPRLFGHRWLQEESYRVAVEKELLLPLMREATQALTFLIKHRYIRAIDPELFILTMDRILFGYFLGLNTQNQFLGGNIREKRTRERIKAHIVAFLLSYLGWEEPR